MGLRPELAEADEGKLQNWDALDQFSLQSILLYQCISLFVSIIVKLLKTNGNFLMPSYFFLEKEGIILLVPHKPMQKILRGSEKLMAI